MTSILLLAFEILGEHEYSWFPGEGDSEADLAELKYGKISAVGSGGGGECCVV